MSRSALTLTFLLSAVLSVPAQDFPACPAGTSFPYASKPLSVVFIIDNSGSMNDTDPNENRFKLARSLLDSLHRLAPQAEAGLVVYTRRLMFDWRENPFFQPAFPGDSLNCDSYAPLTGLRSLVGGRPGVDTLRALLAHDNSGDLIHATRLPAQRGNPNPSWNANRLNTRDGTDITLGFQGAKAAMQASTAAPEDRFFILLSDGEPTGVDSIRQAQVMDFLKGEACPATFLVWYGRDGVIPANMVMMMDNIRNNGYSSRNPASEIHLGIQSASLLGELLQRKLLQCRPDGSASIRRSPRPRTPGTFLGLADRTVLGRRLWTWSIGQRQ